MKHKVIPSVGGGYTIYREGPGGPYRLAVCRTEQDALDIAATLDQAAADEYTVADDVKLEEVSFRGIFASAEASL